MALIEELQKKNPELFKSEYKEPPFQTIEEKIERLNLSESRIEVLKKMPVEDFTGSYNSDDYVMSYDVIDVDNLVGFKTAHFVKNWFDALGAEVLHKPLTLEMYDSDHPNKFDEYLIAENKNNPPSVIEIDGKYFVDGDGTHRLTIAKVLGNKKARVVVRRSKSE